MRRLTSPLPPVVPGFRPTCLATGRGTWATRVSVLSAATLSAPAEGAYAFSQLAIVPAMSPSQNSAVGKPKSASGTSAT
jgi:hypothetical protein